MAVAVEVEVEAMALTVQLRLGRPPMSRWTRSTNTPEPFRTVSFQFRQVREAQRAAEAAGCRPITRNSPSNFELLPTW